VTITEEKSPSKLSGLPLEELAAKFEKSPKRSDDFEFNLSQARILFEARQRFKSDIEYGRWLKKNELNGSSQQHRTRLLHLVKFFDGRDITGIEVSSGYQISAPKHAFVALDCYEQVVGKNLSFKETIKILHDLQAEHHRAAGTVFPKSTKAKAPDRTNRTKTRVINGKISYKSPDGARQQLALESSFINALSLLTNQSGDTKSDWINNAINAWTGVKMSAAGIVRCAIVNELVKKIDVKALPVSQIDNEKTVAT